MSKQEGLSVKKNDFSEWYSEVVQKADLADYSSVSGCIVFKPYSYAIWEKIKGVVDEKIKKMGVKNCYFPLFIPEKLLKKESEHVKGFKPQVAWVTQAGGSKLIERLAVRPTSETIMYESYKKWIRSWRDLPLKLNQWNNVVRWEFEHPTPFLRTREFLWNEGHTVFATKKEAEKEVIEIINMYNNILENYLALYGLVGRKSEKEKFAGAEFTLSIEMFMPDGKGIQGPDSHFDGQNFAKAFDIKFLDKDKKEKYVWQNTWAITTRMIGILIAIHGDDKGLVLPPKIAPNKIVIVPIIFKKDKEKVLKKSKEIFRKLKKFDALLDGREGYSVGWKFNEWELKGVPIRLEVGPKDIQKGQVVLVKRDNNRRSIVKEKNLVKEIEKNLNEIQENLFKKSKKFLENSIIKVKNFKEFLKVIKNKKIAFAQWCGGVECEDYIKSKSGGAKSLNIPLEQKKVSGKCFYCGKKAEYWAYFAKSY